MERIRKMSLKDLIALEKLITEERETRIESKLSGICLEVVDSISKLLECCKELNRHYLGSIEIECEECDLGMDFDILNEGILEDIQQILRGYLKEE